MRAAVADTQWTHGLGDRHRRAAGEHIAKQCDVVDRMREEPQCVERAGGFFDADAAQIAMRWPVTEGAAE